MTIKECIDIIDNLKPNQYSVKEKVIWLSFIDSIIINDVLKTHEGYDGRYDEFTGYSEEKMSIPLIVPSPYDQLYPAYLKMKIDGENGETARYNNSAAEFNAYMMEYRKYYHKTHMPLDKDKMPTQKSNPSINMTDAMFENLKRELYYLLSEDFAKATSKDKLYDIITEYAQNNIEMFKGKDGADGKDGIDGEKGEKGDKGDKGDTGLAGRDGKDAIDTCVNKVNGNSMTDQAYIVTAFGEQSTVEIEETYMYKSGVTDFANSIPRRTNNGNLLTKTPTTDLDCANKKYVDDIVGDIETLLGGI